MDPEIWSKMVVVPLSALRVRVAKYDLVLREAPLQATRAMHTILTSMLLFRCWHCNARFPTWHPAYDPTAVLDLELCKSGSSGLAVCDVQVAVWDDFPRMPGAVRVGAQASEPEVAEIHTGVCKSCQLDIEQQSNEQACLASADWNYVEQRVVPKMSYLNNMDPCWNFPHSELGELFASATVTEGMLIALEHMQVSFVTVRKTGLEKFRKNTIS